MRPNPQFPTYLVTFTEEILTGTLNFLCSVRNILHTYLGTYLHTYLGRNIVLFHIATRTFNEDAII